jgi:DNA polymerase-3 subunit gamma/tau
MALALYRKYRPTTFEDLKGQDAIATLLKNAGKENALGHAYLFFGPRGTGKTTTARLIAKLANCEKRREDAEFQKTGEPCNTCAHCMGVDQGSSLDVIEIDAASNRGIDEIRNLKDTIRTLPSSGTTKVYIIDEAHMLTGAAWNALLKTLEEPPAHAVIVLATTEYDKLPATIISRTQRFGFKRIPKQVLLTKLKAIVKEEKLKATDAALDLIASAAEGSFRDAESLLAQLASAGTTLDEQSAAALTGRASLGSLHTATLLIAERNLQGILAHIESITEEGHSLSAYTRDLIEYLRKTLTLAANPKLKDAFAEELAPHDLEALELVSKKMSLEEGTKITKALIRAYQDMRYSPFAGAPLELALIETLG